MPGLGKNRKLSINDKIEQQKLVVSKVKDRYEAELEELNQLMKKRDELSSWRGQAPGSKLRRIRKLHFLVR